MPALDPHYRLLLGRLFDRFQKDYPVHEQLPTASLPDDMVGQVVQHRFRVAKDDWPLVQVGPGVFTVNDTQHYTWTDFEQRAKKPWYVSTTPTPTCPNSASRALCSGTSTRWSTTTRTRTLLTSSGTS